MPFSFNPSAWKGLVPHLFALLVISAVAKILSVTALYLLPATSLETPASTQQARQYVAFKGEKIFGSVASSKEEAKASPETTQKSETLHPLTALQIVGIFHSESLSFITLKEGQGVVFLEVGESYKGYRLEEIHPLKAIFSRGGKRYELSLKDDEIDRKVTAATQKKPEEPAEQTMKNVPRDEIKAYQKDMSRIWSNIGIRENKRGGKMDGFIVTFVKRGSVFQKLGLQKDDVLVAANGIELKSYKDALTLYKQIDNMKVFKLTIRRNNQEKELEYEIF